MLIYRVLCCALPPLSPWVTGLMHSCCYGGGWQCVNQKNKENVENMELASKILHMIIPKTLII